MAFRYYLFDILEAIWKNEQQKKKEAKTNLRQAKKRTQALNR